MHNNYFFIWYFPERLNTIIRTVEPCFIETVVEMKISSRKWGARQIEGKIAVFDWVNHIQVQGLEKLGFCVTQFYQHNSMLIAHWLLLAQFVCWLGFITIFIKHYDVLVQCYPSFKFYFLLFWDMVMYVNDLKTKENKMWTKYKIE